MGGSQAHPARTMDQEMATPDHARWCTRIGSRGCVVHDRGAHRTQSSSKQACHRRHSGHIQVL
eukprot:7568514-Karenia_brevis.AAC.1